MQVDVIRAQHQQLRIALVALASLTQSFPERLASALAAVERAFDAGTPVWAAPHVETIRTLLGADREAIAARLMRCAPDQLEELVATFVELYTIACREYWTA